MDFEVSPRLGVGPVKLGMTRDQVREVLGQSPMARAKTDRYFDNALRVDFDDEGHAELVELWSSEHFTAMFLGQNVFAVPAVELVKAIACQSPYDPNDPELGYAFTFPGLGISLWREHLPESDQDGAGRYFDTVAVAVQGYWD